MGLINLFGQTNSNNVTLGTNAGTVSGTNNVSQVSMASQSDLQNVTSGQVLTGQVTDKTADAVKLLVNLNGKEVELEARLTQNMALSVGKNLVFQIKNNGGSFALNPLFENMGMEQNAKKALDYAQIPENEKSLYLVSNMMKEGMSIDKNSLSSIYHQSVLHPDAEVMDLIDLNKLGLPVTEENLTQIASYKNLTHQLSGAISDMANALPEALNELLEKGNVSEAMKLLDVQIKESTEQQSSDIPKTVITGENQVVNETRGMEEASQLPRESIVIQQENPEVNGNTMQGQIAEAKGENRNQQMEDSSQNVSVSVKLEQLLKEYKEGTISEKDAGKVLKELLNKEDGKEALKEVFTKELTMKPEMTDKEGIKKLYQSLNKQMNTLMNILKDTQMENSNLGRLVQNTSQNLEFLDQVNQMYSYLQLPFKLQGREANGELYVYTNKKNLSVKEGEVSAFLHLDMQNLGPVDCLVKMQEQNVSTKFTLQDDEMLDFLNEHMDILTNRLRDRGYEMNVRLTRKDADDEDSDNKNGVLRELIEHQSNRPMASQLSFDVRT